jgi:hypothetical protein
METLDTMHRICLSSVTLLLAIGTVAAAQDTAPQLVATVDFEAKVYALFEDRVSGLITDPQPFLRSDTGESYREKEAGEITDWLSYNFTAPIPFERVRNRYRVRVYALTNTLDPERALPKNLIAFFNENVLANGKDALAAHQRAENDAKIKVLENKHESMAEEKLRLTHRLREASSAESSEAARERLRAAEDMMLAAELDQAETAAKTEAIQIHLEEEERVVESKRRATARLYRAKRDALATEVRMLEEALATQRRLAEAGRLGMQAIHRDESEFARLRSEEAVLEAEAEVERLSVESATQVTLEMMALEADVKQAGLQARREYLEDWLRAARILAESADDIQRRIGVLDLQQDNVRSEIAELRRAPKEPGAFTLPKPVVRSVRADG